MCPEQPMLTVEPNTRSESFGKKLFEEFSMILENVFFSSSGGKRLAYFEAKRDFHSLLGKAHQAGGIVYIIGNGTSSSIASIVAADLMKFHQIPSQTLFDVSMLTANANDDGYPCVYDRPLHVLLKENDLLIALSSSGRSQNLLSAVEVASKKGCRIITLSGKDAHNPLRSKGDLNIFLPSKSSRLVEIGHLFLLHILLSATSGTG